MAIWISILTAEADQACSQCPFTAQAGWYRGARSQFPDLGATAAACVSLKDSIIQPSLAKRAPHPSDIYTPAHV